MILQDEQTGFWCHTLLVENPYKIRFENKGKTNYGRHKIFINLKIHFFSGENAIKYDLVICFSQ